MKWGNERFESEAGARLMMDLINGIGDPRSVPDLRPSPPDPDLARICGTVRSMAQTHTALRNGKRTMLSVHHQDEQRRIEYSDRRRLDAPWLGPAR